MMRRFVTLLSILVAFLINSCDDGPVQFNDSIEVYTEFADLQETIDSYADKLLVVNFWATSCPPCIRAMPHFNELQEANPHVKILLVSLDMTEHLESRVYPFVDKYGIQPEIALLQDQNYSAWTDQIDPSWYGALPATVMIRGDERNFKFGAYKSYDELLGDVEGLE